MATVNEAITAKFGVDLTAFNQGLVKAQGQVTRSTQSMTQRFAAFSQTALGLAGLGGGLYGLQRLATGILNVNRETEQLQASLRTVTGSATAANTAFAGIQKFAEETPFQIEEIATAFIRLKSIGLDPSEAALRAYGNTAAAMGKSLMQFIEAIADATTGQFERLKDFGIRASQQGEQVTFTFRGVSTTVQKTAADIEGYLRRIGEVEFAGAMREQMKTINGLLSLLSDNLSQFARALGEAGLNAAIKALIGRLVELTNGINENREAIKAFAAESIAGIAGVGRAVVGLGGLLKNTAELTIDAARVMGLAWRQTFEVTKSPAEKWEELQQAMIPLVNDVTDLENAYAQFASGVNQTDAAIRGQAIPGQSALSTAFGRTTTALGELRDLMREYNEVQTKTAATTKDVGELTKEMSIVAEESARNWREEVEKFDTEAWLKGLGINDEVLREQRLFAQEVDQIVAGVQLQLDNTELQAEAQAAVTERAKELQEQIKRTANHAREVAQGFELSRVAADGLSSVIETMIFRARSLGSVLKNIGLSIFRTALSVGLQALFHSPVPIPIPGGGGSNIAPTGGGGGAFSAQHGLMLPSSAAGNMGLLTRAHPGEVILPRRAVESLGQERARTLISHPEAATGGATFNFTVYGDDPAAMERMLHRVVPGLIEDAERTLRLKRRREWPMRS